MAWGVYDYPDPPVWWQMGPDDGDDGYYAGYEDDYDEESFP